MMLRVFFASIALASLANGQRNQGDPSCPCLTQEERGPFNEEITANLIATLGNSNVATYGIGCVPHDEQNILCADAAKCASQVPLPLDCDRSFCFRPWCFVDPDNCKLLSGTSVHADGLHFSYATCGELDSFTFTERLRSLKGRSFNVGFNSNSGGWKGAYNPEGQFVANRRWHGPIVDFIKDAALEGGFTINITQPPDFLREKSRKFFGDSQFDLCVYATALGYLDFCVGAYTISNRRSSVTTFYETSNDPLYLIVFDEEEETSWESFFTSTATVFQPFTFQAWLMIFLFSLPVLGVLFLFHEYDAPGSAYMKEEQVMVESSTGKKEIVTRKIPMLTHVMTSVYMGGLSFWQGTYDHSVVTAGGKINLLAICSFIMLIIAVYTANLAAILTQDASAGTVDSLDAALKLGYNFCASRQVALLATSLYGVSPSRIVPDPVDLGGDGNPGFACPDCNSRSRVFQSMRHPHSDSSLYCDAAIASAEDLDVFHASGEHCDKTRRGDALGFRTIGIPVYDGVSEELVSLFHQLKTEGVMNKALLAARPSSACPETSGEGTALTVKQLTGVWVITFGFAVIGLLFKFVYPVAKKRRDGTKERKLRRYDQWLNPPGYDVNVAGCVIDAEDHELRLETSEEIENQ